VTKPTVYDTDSRHVFESIEIDFHCVVIGFIHYTLRSS